MNGGGSSNPAPAFAPRAGGVLGNAALEQIRERGADAVMALNRLVRVGLIHAPENDAVGRTIDQSAPTLRDFALVAGGRATFTFLGDTVFVCGQLLRASRMAYDSAIALGELFARSGVSEVCIDAQVTRDELAKLAEILTASLRSAGGPSLPELKIPNILLRQTDALLMRAEGARRTSTESPSLRLYASALVVMRRFFDEIASGSTTLTHRVKRIAQGFVLLAETGDVGFLGLTALSNAHRDDAGRAVQTAVLAIAIAREITQDSVVLARVAMTALLADVGRVRLAGVKGRDRFVPLSESADAEVPAATGAVVLGLGGVNPGNALCTVVTYETTHLEREQALGPVHGGNVAPLLEAKILRVARAMLDRVAPRDTSRSKSVLDALGEVAKIPGIDHLVVRLLIKAVGLTPVGSVVELDSGHWAVVVGPSSIASALDRPRIRIVMDRSGAVIEPPREVDLGAPPEGKTYPRIVRVMDPQQARFNVARAFVG
jgi:HD-GYP domain-containing protein (c-di-GMP phosphodiesterase class II)